MWNDIRFPENALEAIMGLFEFLRQIGQKTVSGEGTQTTKLRSPVYQGDLAAGKWLVEEVLYGDSSPRCPQISNYSARLAPQRLQIG